MMVEGIHWLPEQDPADVAWKLVATNLSDLAAKGAQPLGVLLGYGLGGGEARFLAGLEEVLRAFAVPLLGGDTVRRGASATHGLTALGRATHRPVPSRKGARAGDTLWVTGTLGALGGQIGQVGGHQFPRDIGGVLLWKPVDAFDHHVVGEDQAFAAKVDHGHVVVEPARGRILREGAQGGDEGGFGHGRVRHGSAG